MEFPGLFEHLAADDSDHRKAQRKAIALATKRSKVRFSNFLSAAATEEEYAGRFALIEDDFDLTIRAACAECGCELDADAIKESVKNTLEPVKREASISKEARRPRMCPYHKEVTDISLASGDPTAGFNAMAQHAWGGQHCQGNDYEGAKCNFKPDMVTQTYWDNKAEQAEQRRQERQEQQQAVELNTLDFDDPATQDDFLNEVQENIDLDTDAVVDSPVEPSAVGVGELEPMAASTKNAEALKTVDVTEGGDGPSPKMDKRKWTVDNITPLETEGEGSPHPTKRIDILEPVSDDRGEDFLEGTKAVTEQQDVTKEWSHPRGEAGSWSTNDGQTQPVSKVASGDTPYFHNGMMDALAQIESKFPGVTFNGEPFWQEPVTRENRVQLTQSHPHYMQTIPGAVGHTNPQLDPILRQVGETDGGLNYKKAIMEALKGGGPAQQGGPQPGPVASVQKHSPGKKHLPAASPKRNRQYEHIKSSCLARGGSEEECEELAARTVNKQRAEHGETKDSAAQDVEKNPLKELIDNGFEGFVPQAQVEKAIEDHNE